VAVITTSPSILKKLWSKLRAKRADPDQGTIPSVKTLDVNVTEIAREVRDKSLEKERAEFTKRQNKLKRAQEAPDFEMCQGHRGGITGLWNASRG
jgi:hypothetical protein